MKKPVRRSYDELVRGYYGAFDVRRSLSTMADEMVSNRYGKPWRRSSGAGRVAVSLCFDSNEVLPQRLAQPASRQYVVEQSAPTEPQEYIVEAPMLEVTTKPVPVTPDAPARAASFALAPTEPPASPAEEYLVDVLEPLRASPAPLDVAPARPPVVPEPPGAPALVAERPATSGDGARAVPGPDAAKSAPPTSHAQADEDDFMADMKAILTGRKVYDPKEGKTVEKADLGRQASHDPSPAGPLPGAPQPSDSQAIFDRIAQSLQYANAFDLGTVELENRFADFDRVAEQEQRASERKRVTKTSASPSRSAPPQDAVAALSAPDTTDFVRDLELIQAERGGSSVAHDLTLERYSRPLYDAGEHVLVAADVFVDQLRVGKNPGVPCSYGHIIAMADLFATVSDMMKADVKEIQGLKALLDRSLAYYQGGKKDRSLDPDDTAWENATRDRYLKLADDNYEHFAPGLLKAGTPPARAWRNHRAKWEEHHKLAIDEARALYLSPANANVSVFPEWPFIINAFGDHFLTDAFASGHLINKAEVMEAYGHHFNKSGGGLNSAGQTFFARLAEKAWRGEVKKKFSVLETYKPVFLWWNPNIDTQNAFRKLLVAIANERPDEVANLAVKALHDHLNANGLEVTNDAGDGVWLLKGDGWLDKNKTQPIMRRAVEQSIANIEDPSIRASNVAYGNFFERVWRHVPRPTEPSRKKLVALLDDYTRPDSAKLLDAAAALVTHKVDTLIKKLKDEKKLKDA